MLDIYTDGSKRGLGGGWGAVFVKNGIETQTIYGTIATGTSFLMELIAACNAIRYIYEFDGLPTHEDEYVRLYSDCQSLVLTIKSDLSKRRLRSLPYSLPNRAYRQPIFEASKFYDLEFHHIPRMVDDELHQPHHIKAHRVARLAAMGEDVRRIYGDAEEFTGGRDMLLSQQSNQSLTS